MLEELEKFEPLVSDVCQNIIATIDNQSDYIHELNEDIFSKFPDISIDYAVFEKQKLQSLINHV